MTADAPPAPTSAPRTMEVLRPVIPLLTGVGLLMMANGLQSSLVSLRATAEGFGSLWTGVVVSAYFAGFLIGARLSASWIQRVGHVRAFAAFASIASTLILIHLLAINVPVWILARLASGICVSGLLVIIESWLNRSTDNRSRGKVLSSYMVVSIGGFAVGQVLLAISPVESFELFALVSVLLSVALIPVILSRRSNPEVVAVVPMRMTELIRRTPGGATSSAMAGMTWAAIAGWSPVVAATIGLSGIGVTGFVGAFLVGHLAFEPVVGRLSDRHDRRVIVIVIATIAAIASIIGAIVGEREAVLIPLAVVIGGATLPLYSLSIAQAGDRLAPDEMVSAAGSLVRINGLGAAVGPVVAAAATTRSIAGFYLVIAVGTLVAAVVAATLLARSGYRAPEVPYLRLVTRGTAPLTTAALRASGRARRAARRVTHRRPRAAPDQGR